MASEWSNRGARRARETREQLGRAQTGPLPDVLEAAERTGVHVLLLELDPRVAGAYVARPDVPLVVVNGRQPLVRQRFTLAHELGHHRMGHGSVVDRQEAIGGRLAGDRDEVAANAFAAELLMPRAAVAAWGEQHVRGAATLEHVLLLAREYGVSAQAARYALAGAGVLRDARRERLLDEEIASGMHVELRRWLGLQPIEDGLADAAAALPRIPGALRGTALGDFLATAIGVDELARRVGAEPDAVRAMLRALGLDRLASG